MDIISDLNENLEDCCDSPEYVIDEKCGEIICTNCALVVGTSYCLDKRVYENSKHLLQNAIFLKDSSTLEYWNVKKYYSNKKNSMVWIRRSRINNRNSSSLTKCINYYYVLLSNLNRAISNDFQSYTKGLILKGINDRISRGRHLESLVESALYLTLKSTGISSGLKKYFQSISVNYTRAKSREILYFIDYFKKTHLKNSDKIHNSKNEFKTCLLHLANKFFVPKRVMDDLMNAVNSKIYNNKIFGGKAMDSIASGVFYYCCKKNEDIKVPIKKISKNLGLTEVTVRNNFKLLCMIKLKNDIESGKTPSKELADEDFMNRPPNTIKVWLNEMEIMCPELQEKIKLIKTFY